MKILFDHNVDRRFRKHLPAHVVRTAREMSWDSLGNGALLRAAASGNFVAIVTIDKDIEFEQNLRALPLAVVVLDVKSNALPLLLPLARPLSDLLLTPLDHALYVIERSGAVVKLTAPRKLP